MEPIINPLWIYLIGISDDIKIALELIFFISFSISALWIACFMIRYTSNRCPKFLYVITIISGILVLFTPSRETILSMLVVNQLTPNNIEIAGNTIEDTVDYIFDKIDEITDEDKD